MNLKRNLDDIVYETICNGFADGTYLSGKKLVPAELAEKYGVSMTPVTQALKRMGYEGILSVTSGGKYFIPIYDHRQVLEICEVRLMIEKYAVQALCERWSDDMHRQLLTHADQAEAHLRDERFTDHVISDMSFHRKMVELSGNDCLISFFNIVISKYLVAYYVADHPPKHMQIASREHHQLIALLERGETAEAESLIQSHIYNAQQRMYGHLVHDTAL